MASLVPSDTTKDTNENEDKSSHEGDSTDKADADEHKANSVITWNLVLENYVKQTKQWPSSGCHILAQFDDTSVVVYQAFKPSIAEFAVKHQRFGGPSYNLKRMSWIKTSFMWMMYRCGWAQKVDQERVLAVRITKEGFDNILSKALTGQKQKSMKIEDKDVEVRLQWDPDHDPNEKKLARRAIQLGLKGKTLFAYTSTYIIGIKDITEFVREQHNILKQQGQHAIMTPREELYIPSNSKTCDQIELDFIAEQTVVSFKT